MRRIKILIALASLMVVPVEAQRGVGHWQERLLSAAREYRAWGRVDEHGRWAPMNCDMPPSRARFSSDGQGRKIYFLYASDVEAYRAAIQDGGATPIGQVIVKESFHPVEATSHDSYLPATEDGHSYRAGAPMGLYLMTYLGPDAPGTDAGWIYGTIDPSGEVTSAGRVQSCMGCHQEAPHGRLFGISQH